MEFGTPSGSEKSKNEPVRIPSPASVSSVHSIRPLEWDSGADIGYEFKHQSALSTVERIALKSGTLNLLESCIARDTSTNRSYVKKYIGNPLAQSSPFISSTETTKKDETPPSTNVNQFRPLVDYTISEYSIDEKVEKLEFAVPAGVEVIDKRDRVSKLRSDEGSKSLDDLRLVGRKRISNNRSRSSQNLLTATSRNPSEKNSSSSLATLVPSLEGFSNRKYSNKSVQVDDICLVGGEPENDGASVKSSLEFFRQICNRDTNDDDPRNPQSKRGSECNNCTDEESVDGGSFEYVPGSRYVSQALESKYTSDAGSKGGSSVNTWCSEVTDGVALLTKYVNELNVSNKHHVIEKVAKSLMNHLSRFERSSRTSHAGSRDSNLLLKSSPEFNAGTRAYSSNSTGSDSRSPSTKSKIDSSSSHYVESSVSTKGSWFPASQSEATGASSKDSSRLPASLTSFRRGPSYSIDTESNCRTDSKLDSKSSSSNRVTPRSFSLKEYLKSERDVQLMWIKSNIDHLNNLRKLCESQKVLCKKSSALKKSTSVSRSAKNLPQSEVHEKHSSRRKHPIRKRRSVLEACGNHSEQTSDNMRSCDSNGVLSTSESVNRTSTSKYDIVQDEKQHTVSPNENACSCSRKSRFRESNKENVLTDATTISRCGKSTPTRKSKGVATSKQPISYTILFDKGPTFRVGKRYKVKEYVKRKSVSRVTHGGKKITRTESVTQLHSASEDVITDRTVPLQDYLINNKPEYVNRAEYRRQCLAEIARLRELRDKSRGELLFTVRNVDEINDEIAKSVAVPPPLSVVRLFDDKTIKKETERKYQQLPEVQNKKLELQRRDTYRRNHLMAKVYTKKLQRKVLRGQMNLGNDVNVLSI